MPEAVVVLSKRRNVVGHLRQVEALSITLAAQDDWTWTVPGIKRIETALIVNRDQGSQQFEVNGNVVTIHTNGGTTFIGSVLGL